MPSPYSVADPRAFADYLTANPQSATPTKRATQYVCGDGGNTATWSDVCWRGAITLPVTTTRWRFRVKNWNRGAGTLNAGTLNYTGLYQGTPVVAGGSWTGDFTGAPTQILPAFVPPTDGSEYISPWVTSSAFQFTRYTAKFLSFGYTSSAVTVNVGFNSSWFSYGTSGTLASGSTAVATLTAGTGGGKTNNYGAVDTVIEYEFVGTNPVGFFCGDSITSGYAGNATVLAGVVANSCGPMNAWPELAASRSGFVAVNGGVGGDTATNWTTVASNGRYSRFDLTTTPPDFAVVFFGANEAVGSRTLSNYQNDIAGVVTALQGTLGIQRIYVSTTIPNTSLTAGAETIRQSYNTWLRQGVAFTAATIDFASVLEAPTTSKASLNSGTPVAAAADPPQSQPNLYLMQLATPHPNPAGYQRMAEFFNAVVRV